MNKRAPSTSNVRFDVTLLFDTTASDHVLREQWAAFIREGHAGSELVKMILHHLKPGLASHVSRLLSLDLLSFNEGIPESEEHEQFLQRCSDDVKGNI